jgi:hypothetical protein
MSEQTDANTLLCGGGLIRDITVCHLPYQSAPFVHGWIQTPDGQRDVWLRSDGLWTTEEGDARNALLLSAGWSLQQEPAARDEAAIAQLDSLLRSNAIPEGVYYSEAHANFYRERDGCGMGEAFYEQWRSRCGEFPSLWQIQDHLGTCRAAEVSRSAAGAIAQYAVKRDISSKDISHWRAVRR